MKAPGEAYDNPLFGKDPQPSHMDQFQLLPDTRAGDLAGVRFINSGIPNRAFFLVASALRGNAWEAPGHIWYETLTKNSGPQAQFQDFADATFGVAGRLYRAPAKNRWQFWRLGEKWAFASVVLVLFDLKR